MRKSILLVVLTASLSIAQEIVTSLDSWKVHSGDDPRWAAPDFDDSDWESSGPPRNFQTGFSWYRRAVTIPAQWKGQKLDIGIAQILEAFEVYVEGERIGGSGVLAPAPMGRFEKHLVFAVPLRASAGTTVHIAIRRWCGRHPVAAAYLTHPPQLGLAELIRTREELHGFEYARRRLPNLAGGFLLVAVGLVALLWFRERRDHTEYLWLGLTMCATAIWPIAGFLAGEFELPIRSVLSSVALASPTVAVGLSALFFRRICPQAKWLLYADAFFGITLGIVFGGSYWSDTIPWSGFVAYQFFSRSARIIVALLLAWGRNWSSLAMAGSWVFVIFAGQWFGEAGQAAGYLLFGLVCLSVLYLRFRQEQRAQQVRQQELAAGQHVQQMLMEGSLESSITFQVEKAYLPASEVGGDFYQIISRGDGGLLMVVGDVSGKGLRAAMVVSLVIGALRNRRSDDPGAILSELNHALVGQMGGGFVTCCCAHFRVDGMVTLANAGHPSPYCDGRELETEAGLPLGIAPGVQYAESVARGERFTFISDGVVEAENAQRELFGFDRTREISGKSAQEIADAAKAWGQNDDITVVTVRRKNDD